MSRLYKTARGKNIDIDKVKLANETAVAVGNMKTNARGDLLGPGNQVSATRNQVMDRVYAVEEAPYSPNDPKTFLQQKANAEAKAAKELEKVVENKVDIPVEVPVETKVPATTATPRGSLASSIKKS